MSATTPVISRFINYYAELDIQPPSALVELYDPGATLVDPFGKHEGLPAIERYFSCLLANVVYCRFSVDPPICHNHRVVVTWTMRWSHPRIAGGEALALEGCSLVDIQNNLIVRQRDYYDAGEMIYERIPFLGCAVRAVKRRVRS